MDFAARASGNARLKSAVRSSRLLSKQGILESVFAVAFKGMVYPQIWEDPEVDLEALDVTPESEVVTIASGGCNVLSYLTANPKHIAAVDLNATHVALTRLKLAAVIHLPSWRAFHRFFGNADDRKNIEAYWHYLAPKLDNVTRSYWEARTCLGMGGRRISLFSRNFYRHGLLGRFIGLCHAVARAYGVDPREFLQSGSIDQQREYFSSVLAPLFDKPLVRWASASPLSLYGLGIPPVQHAVLGSSGCHVASDLRMRLMKLTCSFSLQENYFAWQAFGRRYAENGPLPRYLQPNHFAEIRARARRVEVINASLTEYLTGRAANSLDRYVLLDAQDWMADHQLIDLWREITRTARPSARVIFRTAGRASPLPGRPGAGLLDRWNYDSLTSRRLSDRDRSAIYGGFHLYIRAE